MNVPPHVVAMLGLLALVPATVYAGATGRVTEIGVILSFFTVLLIVGSLVFMFGPDTGEPTDHTV